MKINKKGFTLIELLAVIIVLGLVLSVSTYFVVVSIKNSKEKAYETSKKGLLNSAIAYANEFNEEKDWVEGDPEYTCIKAWWLVNKGIQKKESFTENGEEYKFKKSDIVILYRDENKVITDAELSSSAPEDCKNLLRANASLTSTVNTITVDGTCTIKDQIPAGIQYRYCISVQNESNCTEYTNESSHTFTGLTNNTNYNINLECKLGDDETGDQDHIKTKMLNSPSIICDEGASNTNSNNVRVNFNNSDNSLVKTVAVNKTGVKYDNTDIGTTPRQYTSSPMDFDISDITGDYVIFTATVSDMTPNNNITVSKNCYKKEQETSPPDSTPDPTPLAPYFIASDDVESGKWHANDFYLSILDHNTHTVDYYVGTDQNSLTEKYDGSLFVNTEKTTYYAKACNRNNSSNCSGIVSYSVLIDKTPPTIDLEVSNGSIDLTNKKTVTISTSDCSNYSNCDNWKEAYTYYESESDLLTWISYNLQVNFKISDEGASSGLKSKTYGESASGKSKVENFKKEPIEELDGRTKLTVAKNFTANGYMRAYLQACDVVGHCTEKNVYFKIDKEQPKISYDGIVSNDHYGFTCKSGLSGIYRFFGSDSSGGGANSSRYNPYGIQSQSISNDNSGYWFNQDGDIYTSCSARTIELPNSNNNYVTYHYTAATYSIKTKTSSTTYVWNCPEFGVAGNRFEYTQYYSNPYPGHCDIYDTWYSTSPCPAEYTQISGSKKCYIFASTEY